MCIFLLSIWFLTVHAVESTLRLPQQVKSTGKATQSVFSLPRRQLVQGSQQCRLCAAYLRQPCPEGGSVCGDCLPGCTQSALPTMCNDPQCSVGRRNYCSSIHRAPCVSCNSSCGVCLSGYEEIMGEPGCRPVTPEDPCLNHTCAHNATCLPRISASGNGNEDGYVLPVGDSYSNRSYTCVCPPGFTGNFCEIDITNPGCDPQFCLNGGTCIQQNSTSRFCVCPDGFAGTNCEIPDLSTSMSPVPSAVVTATASPSPIATCSQQLCLNGGHCIIADLNLTERTLTSKIPNGQAQSLTATKAEVEEEHVSWKCVCQPGFQGEVCEVPMSQSTVGHWAAVRAALACTNEAEWDWQAICWYWWVGAGWVVIFACCCIWACCAWRRRQKSKKRRAEIHRIMHLQSLRDSGSICATPLRRLSSGAATTRRSSYSPVAGRRYSNSSEEADDIADPLASRIFNPLFNRLPGQAVQGVYNMQGALDREDDDDTSPELGLIERADIVYQFGMVPPVGEYELKYQPRPDKAERAQNNLKADAHTSCIAIAAAEARSDIELAELASPSATNSLRGRPASPSSTSVLSPSTSAANRLRGRVVSPSATSSLTSSLRARVVSMEHRPPSPPTEEGTVLSQDDFLVDTDIIIPGKIFEEDEIGSTKREMRHTQYNLHVKVPRGGENHSLSFSEVELSSSVTPPAPSDSPPPLNSPQLDASARSWSARSIPLPAAFAPVIPNAVVNEHHIVTIQQRSGPSLGSHGIVTARGAPSLPIDPPPRNPPTSK